MTVGRRRRKDTVDCVELDEDEVKSRPHEELERLLAEIQAASNVYEEAITVIKAPSEISEGKIKVALQNNLHGDVVVRLEVQVKFGFLYPTIEPQVELANHNSFEGFLREEAERVVSEVRELAHNLSRVSEPSVYEICKLVWDKIEEKEEAMKSSKSLYQLREEEAEQRSKAG